MWRCLMAVTYKRQDDLEKMLEEFASFDALKEKTEPKPNAEAEKK